MSGPGLWRDAVAFVANSVGAYAWVKMFGVLVTKGILEVKLSRKLIHVSSGTIFMLTWVGYRRGH